MNRYVITQEGLNILNDNLANGDKTQYWIGYYGLAYIPDELRQTNAPCELTRYTNVLVPRGADGKPLGDELFNIFQGSMADTVAGFDEGDVDSPAHNLYKQCLYADNIESTYRYSLLPDNEGNKINTLITFSQDASNPSRYHLYHTYIGTGCCESGMELNDFTDPQVIESAHGIPIPAPLFYASNMNDRCLTKDVVTADMRNYSEHLNPDWAASNDGTRINVVAETESDKLSISNFNRYHAPSSSEGYAVAHEQACRNMAKVTKYFPIEHYDISSIIHDGGLIQNLEAGKSSTNVESGKEIDESSFENAKVGAVKYKIRVTIGEYIKKSANRIFESAYSLDPQNHNVKPPKIGFKFNRIGLYAVPVTLHSFNVVAADNEKCGGNKVQLEVNGDKEPVLFAVIDIDTVEMSETGLGQFDIDCSVNFQEDTALVNEPVIYYNLYENDSITWYKNQLLATASMSEAVTTLSVELNYLRNMIEAMNSRGSECGIGDDGDMWAFKNHTHPYMRNIVDSGDTTFGAVRGIYTLEEYKPYYVYRTCGETIADDTNPNVLSKIINVGAYTVGENSMTLGADSLTASGYSLNMSHYGLIDNTARSVLLMGGRGKDTSRKYNDGHLAVSNSVNSIINAERGEFEYLNGSMWITSYTDVYVNGGATHSIGIGRNDVLMELFDENVPNDYTGDKKNGSVSESVLVGRNRVIGDLKVSMIVGSRDSLESQLIGDYDVAADMNDIQMDSDVIGYGDENKIFKSPNKHSSSIVSVGSSNNVQKGAQGVFTAGIENVVPTNSRNLVIVGERINKAEPTYTFDKRFIMTVDEFNERYGDTNRFPYPSDDPIWTHDGTNDIVIIGTGEVNFLNGQESPTTKTVNVKGVTLYISYSSYIWQTDNAYTCGNFNDSETSIRHFGNNPYMYSHLYTKPGNLKNMMMLGDDLNVGNGSSNTIMIGDKSGTRKIKYTNSFINTLGDDFGYNLDKSRGPAGHFNNVWWIGHTESPQDNVDMSHYADDSSEYTGHLIVAQNQPTNGWQNTVFKDRFVFIGDDKNAYGFSYWYGVDFTTTNNVFQISKNSENWKYDINDVYSPCKAPMMYTGGIALGGYGTEECNFMLMKVGTSRKYSDETDNFINIADGYNTNPNLMTYRGDVGKIIRCNHIQGPWVETADNTTLITQTGIDASYLEIGEVTHEFIVPNTRVIITDSVEIAMTDMQGEPLGTMTVSVSGNTITGTIDEAKTVRVKIRLEYKYYDSAGSTIYDYYDPDVQSSHHLMVDCPYKGMALVVQDKQELDGTLHIGLGKTGGMGGGGGTVIIRDALVTYFYIENPSAFWDPTSHITNKMTVYKNGDFNEIPISSYGVQDGYRDYFWDYSVPNHAQEHFSFGYNNNRLVWYTWDCFVWRKNTSPLEEVAISNMKRTLCIWTSDLVDGVVYEVIIYVQAMSASELGYTVRSGTKMNFNLQFYNDDCTVATVYKWADSNSIDYEIYPDFNTYVPETDMTTLTPFYKGATQNSSKSNPILAQAVVHFTKVDGIIYLMTY